MNFQNLMQSIIEGYNQGVTEMCNPNPQQNDPQGYGQGMTPVYSPSTRRNDPQGCDQGGTYLHNPGPISIVPVSERVPGYFDLPTVRSEDNETVTVREFSGKLYVETENIPKGRNESHWDTISRPWMVCTDGSISAEVKHLLDFHWVHAIID